MVKKHVYCDEIKTDVLYTPSRPYSREEITNNLVIEIEDEKKIIAFHNSNDRYRFIFKKDTDLWSYVMISHKVMVDNILAKYKLATVEELKELRKSNLYDY